MPVRVVPEIDADAVFEYFVEMAYVTAPVPLPPVVLSVAVAGRAYDSGDVAIVNVACAASENLKLTVADVTAA